MKATITSTDLGTFTQYEVPVVRTVVIDGDKMLTFCNHAQRTTEAQESTIYNPISETIDITCDEMETCQVCGAERYMETQEDEDGTFSDWGDWDGEPSSGNEVYDLRTFSWEDKG